MQSIHRSKIFCLFFFEIKDKKLFCSQIFLNEIDILSRLNHMNISCLYGVQLDLLYLVQEHSHFGSLQDYFRSLLNQQTNDSTFQKFVH